jgi:hypothetical protein
LTTEDRPCDGVAIATPGFQHVPGQTALLQRSGGTMFSRQSSIRLLQVALVVFCGSAMAHHSSAMFDAKNEITIKGTIKEFDFENPHVRIVVSVPGEKGTPDTEWNFEAASVRGMALAGWRRSSVKNGDVVTAVGAPLKDGRTGAMLHRVILADGTILKSNLGANY